MNLKEKKLNSTQLYSGKVFKARVDEVLLPNNTVSKREVIEHIGGVCVAAQAHDGTFFIVKQFRYPHDAILTEFPAGKKERGEDALETAKRELQEEVGYIAKEWVSLGQCIPTPAYDEEIIDLFYAKDLEFVGQNWDPEEFLLIESLSLGEISNLIMANEIRDAKTICLTFKLSEYMQKHVLSSK